MLKQAFGSVVVALAYLFFYPYFKIIGLEEELKQEPEKKKGDA